MLSAEQAAEQVASPVGAEAIVEETVSARLQDLRARNEECLKTAFAFQTHLSQASGDLWQDLWQRSGSAAERDETQIIPRLLGTAAPAEEPVAAPVAPGASQPGSVPPDGLQLPLVESCCQDSEFLPATLLQQKQASCATERKETAAVFQELLIQNQECVKAMIAHQEQHTEAWEQEAEIWQQR